MRDWVLDVVKFGDNDDDDNDDDGNDDGDDNERGTCLSTIFALWEGAAWWRPCHKKFQSVLEEKNGQEW